MAADSEFTHKTEQYLIKIQSLKHYNGPNSVGQVKLPLQPRNNVILIGYQVSISPGPALEAVIHLEST